MTTFTSIVSCILSWSSQSVSQSFIFIIAGAGSWTVYYDYTTDIGYIISEKTGLLTIPTSGWQYEDEDKWNGDDDTLKFIYN